jgi:hypothetical protein
MSFVNLERSHTHSQCLKIFQVEILDANSSCWFVLQVEIFLFWVEVGWWKYPKKLTCLYLFTSSMYITYKNWHLCKRVYLFTKVPILICSVLKLHSHMILRILRVCSLIMIFLISFLFKCHILCTKDHEQ